MKVLIIDILGFITAIIYLNFFPQSISFALIVSTLSLLFIIIKKNKIHYEVSKLSPISLLPLLFPVNIVLRISISILIFSILNWNFNSKDIYHQFLNQKENKISEMKKQLLQGSKMYKKTVKALNRIEKRIYRFYQKLQILRIIIYFLPLLTLPIIKMHGILAYEEGLADLLLLSLTLSLMCRNSMVNSKNLLYISITSVIIWFI
ncbi:hypothetical protein [Acidianus sp. HS-5]|uniref:hypothetical protein n=1 Tax=Acidianus sp. HS-5 TaxID=2886040 RepID=UPI001F1745E0|nr:hypothetical protein [Acidianus sp. HS-5]